MTDGVPPMSDFVQATMEDVDAALGGAMDQDAGKMLDALDSLGNKGFLYVYAALRAFAGGLTYPTKAQPSNRVRLEVFEVNDPSTTIDDAPPVIRWISRFVGAHLAADHETMWALARRRVGRRRAPRVHGQPRAARGSEPQAALD